MNLLFTKHVLYKHVNEDIVDEFTLNMEYADDISATKVMQI